MVDVNHVFQPDDMVVWREQSSPHGREVIEKLKREYGNGPFRVYATKRSTDPSHSQKITVCLKKKWEDVELISFPDICFRHLVH